MTATAPRPAVRFGDETWTHADLLRESERFGALFVDRLDAGRPPHVAVLLDNVPEYLFALGGAALSGAAIVGLNHTRRDEHLLRDITHTDCQLVITEERHLPLLEPVMDRAAAGARRRSRARSRARAAAPPLPADHPEPDVGTTWALIFTSGTSSAPKAVICSQRRLLTTGNRMVQLMDLTADDVGYICMPLFHSNALMVGWMPSLVAGASVALDAAVLRVGVARRHPPLRRDVVQLHGQAAVVHRRDAGAGRRRRQHVAGRVRQRGRARGGRHVRPRASTSR